MREKKMTNIIVKSRKITLHVAVVMDFTMHYLSIDSDVCCLCPWWDLAWHSSSNGMTCDLINQSAACILPMLAAATTHKNESNGTE